MVIEKNCGHCMWHQPNSKCTTYDAPKIREGKGKGKPAWWVCKCKASKHYYGKGRVPEDGIACQCFENRYESDKKTEEWLDMCHKSKPSTERPRYTRKRVMYVTSKRPN